MKLITISGLDGSGKSTQIDLLRQHFEQLGKKVFYFHAVSFSIANKIASRGQNIKPGERKSVTKASGYTIFLRKIFLVIDLMRFKRLYAKAQSHYDYILSDRYFYDQIVNIFYLSAQDISQNFPWWLKIAMSLIIQPDISFYLEVSPQQILQRQREIDQGIGYLTKKGKLLQDFFQIVPSVHIIDGHSSKEKVLDNIITKTQ